MSNNYQNVIKNITNLDRVVMEQAASHLNQLAKPPGSLGKLEEIALKLCGITASLRPSIDKRCVIVVAADNGVVAEGVSSAPQEVTAVQTLNMLKGVTGINVIANQFSTDLFIVDVGVNADISHPHLIARKIRKSTGNIAKEAAFSLDEAKRAIEVGIDLVRDARDSGYQLIGTGEMGIGNTTTSSAVLAALLDLKGDNMQQVVGKGAGLTEDAFVKKVNVVNTALRLHQPDANDVLGILHQVGGLDLAAMTGVYLGAAYYQLPVVIDGFISIVAALCAARLNPKAKDYMFASHHSFERGYTVAIKALGLKAALHLDMRLGEGSGCPLMFGIMDAAVAVMKDMATFEAAQISTDYVGKVDEIDMVVSE